MISKTLSLIAVIWMLQGCAGAVMVGAVGGAMMVNDERSFSTQLDDTNSDFQIASELGSLADIKIKRTLLVLS